MNENKDFFVERASLFEKYHEGKMADYEKTAFEKHLSKDAEFRSDYKDYVDSRTLVESLGLSGMMKEVIEDKQEKPTKHFPLALKIISIAAVMLMGLFFLWPQSPDNEALFEKHFTTYPNLYSSRVNSQEENLNRALNFYQSGDYIMAIQEFESIDNPNDTISLYLGVSELAIGNYNQAKERLGPIKNQFLEEPRLWYIGLACLKANQPDSVLYYLNDLKGSKKYGEGAKDILTR